MLIIAVCDDNNTDRNEICTTIETYLQNQGIKGKVFAYDSAEKLNSVIESKRLRFDIIFLDIIMGGMDGMTYAHLIRKQDKLVKIVFSTSSTEYVYEGYEVNATGYLVKPINSKKILKNLEKAIGQFEDVAKDSISITSGGVIQRIKINDILYLESRKNQVELVFGETGQRLAIYTKLDDFEQLHHSKMWIRPHQSFIVNFLYIEQYASDKFMLRGGTVIPISRTYKNKARECFYTLLHNE